jgi:hypothetical protein
VDPVNWEEGVRNHTDKEGDEGNGINQFNRSRQTVRSDNVDKSKHHVEYVPLAEITHKLCGFWGTKDLSLTDGNPSDNFTSTPVQIEQHSKIVIS